MVRKEKMRVVFDAYKLKHPNTGLYHFTRELGGALQTIAEREGWSLAFFTPKHCRGLLGTVTYLPVRFIDRLISFCRGGVSVWHSPYQMSPFMPCRKIPAVVTVHDLNFLYEKNEKKQRRRLARLRKNLERADYVVTISEYTRMDLMRYVDLKDKPVEVIYNGCNLYEGEVAVPAGQPEKPFLFAVGTILPKKNWHVLPPLLVGNDYQLCIAGKPSGYAERIRVEAEKWGVGDRVKLLGEIGEAEKHWYLRHCEAFLFPSIAEGFGLPVIEAMAYGKPVFVSRHTSLPEIGGKFAYYFNYEFDPQRMQQEFREGMADFAERGDPEAEKSYARSFSWEHAAEAYAKVYKKLFEQGAIRGGE